MAGEGRRDRRGEGLRGADAGLRGESFEGNDFDATFDEFGPTRATGATVKKRMRDDSVPWVLVETWDGNFSESRNQRHKSGTRRRADRAQRGTWISSACTKVSDAATSSSPSLPGSRSEMRRAFGLGRARDRLLAGCCGGCGATMVVR